MSSEPIAQPTANAEPTATPLRKDRKKRVFMLHDDKMKGIGRFTSTTPRGAAQKAASRGFQNIVLRETGTRVLLHYKGSIVSLDPPKTVSRGDSTITFTKKSEVKFTGKTVWNGSADVCDDSVEVAENPKA